MSMVSVSHAKARLSELLRQVERGEDIVITRHGMPVARLFAISSYRPPVRSLADFRAGMPPWRRPSAALLREHRDREP